MRFTDLFSLVTLKKMHFSYIFCFMAECVVIWAGCKDLRSLLYCLSELITEECEVICFILMT